MPDPLQRIVEPTLGQPGRAQSGYAHADYARSLREFGAPRALEASGGWVLEREIANSTFCDLMGCYPIFSCEDWSELPRDLSALSASTSPLTEDSARSTAESPVSLSMVLDPFGDYDVEQLPAWFPDLCRPFKQHFVVDLGKTPDEFVASSHRRNVRKALRDLTVDIVSDPTDHLNEWHTLYGDLILRHDITGISAFSHTSFAAQLATPGLTMFRARNHDDTVGMVLFYTQGERAYYHLAAYSEAGYELRASFAIFWTAIHHFCGRLKWLSLGASAGLDGDAQDGLSRFKRGWSTGTKTAYLCGKIIHPSAYEKLTIERAAEESTFFPAYRAGEYS